jgi:hypothetical protein
MTEMVARVAMAIQSVELVDSDHLLPEEAQAIARAAIEAMREPTRAMEITGCGNDQCGPMCTDYVWRAMIDAALKNQP